MNANLKIGLIVVAVLLIASNVVIKGQTIADRLKIKK